MDLPTALDADVSDRGDQPMLMYLIKQLELAVRSHLDDLLRPDGLTALQYTALTVLERHPDISVAQLARNSFVTAQSMADMIATLEERGLIGRHRDQADRRRLAIALLPAGQELLDRYRDQVAALEVRMLQGITKPQVTAMRRNLTACHANLTAGQPRLRDYRVPIGEALRLWWDLQSHGKTAKFLYFPDENHWVLSPGNTKAWYGTVLAFLAEQVLGEPWKRPDLL